MGYYFHFSSFLGEKTFYKLENSGLESRFLFCLIFQFYLMYRLICQKPPHFLSAQMALVSTFLKMFIVLGMYNFVVTVEFKTKLYHNFLSFMILWFFGSLSKETKNGKNPHCELFSSLPKIFFKSGCFIFMKAFWAAMWDIRWLIVTSWKLAILVFTYFVCQGIKVKFQAIVSTI